MRTRLPLSLVVVGLTSGVLTGLSASPASAVCDPYSKTCVEDTVIDRDPPSEVRTTVVERTDVVPSSLPFTGGEVLLLGLLGAGALAGGTALVVAGRKPTTA